MRIIFATGNLHKVKEVASLLGERFELLSLKDLGFHEEIPETGFTFEENAEIKAAFISQKYNIDCIADDSGLEVMALNHAPGVYSARYAGIKATDSENTLLLLKNMGGVADRQARFVTVICYYHQGMSFFFEGTLEGSITHKTFGSNGFGYDPIFIPLGYNKTLAEMTPEEKNSISHRAGAIKKLIDFLRKGN